MLYKIFNYIISIIFNGIVSLILYIILCDLPINLKFFIGKSEFNYVYILCPLVFFIMGIDNLNIFIENPKVMHILRAISMVLLVFYLIQGKKIIYSEYENIITTWKFTFAREPSRGELYSFIDNKLKEYELSPRIKLYPKDYEKLIVISLNENNVVSLKMLSDNIEGFVTYVNNFLKKYDESRILCPSLSKALTKDHVNYVKNEVYDLTKYYVLSFCFTMYLYTLDEATETALYIICYILFGRLWR